MASRLSRVVSPFHSAELSGEAGCDDTVFFTQQCDNGLAHHNVGEAF